MGPSKSLVWELDCAWIFLIVTIIYHIFFLNIIRQMIGSCFRHSPLLSFFYFLLFTYSLLLIWFLNTIINFYLNFNILFFNYDVSHLKLIILIINCSIKIGFLLLKIVNWFWTWFYHSYDFISFESHKIWTLFWDFLLTYFKNYETFLTEIMTSLETLH